MKETPTHGLKVARDTRCDLMRGLGILLVLYIHNASCGELSSRMINSFFMPMFFLLSGMFFHSAAKRDLGDFVKRLLSSILFPYLFFAGLGAVVVLVRVLLVGEAWPTTTEILLSLIDGKPFSCRNLWFLMALGVCQFALWLALRMNEKFRWRTIFWCCIVFVCLTAQLKISALRLSIRDAVPFRLVCLPSGFLMLSIGYFIRPAYEKLRKVQIRRIDAFALCGVCCFSLYLFASIEPSYRMDSGLLPSPAIYATAFIGTFMTFFFSSGIGGAKWLAWIGRNSLFLFALDGSAVGPFARIVVFKLTGQRYCFLSFALVLLLLPLAFWVVARPYEWMKQLCKLSR